MALLPNRQSPANQTRASAESFIVCLCDCHPMEVHGIINFNRKTFSIKETEQQLKRRQFIPSQCVTARVLLPLRATADGHGTSSGNHLQSSHHRTSIPMLCSSTGSSVCVSVAPQSPSSDSHSPNKGCLVMTNIQQFVNPNERDKNGELDDSVRRGDYGNHHLGTFTGGLDTG